MTLGFGAVCALLQSLEDISLHDPPYQTTDRDALLIKETQKWFRIHRRTVDDLSITGSTALLSTLLPERRTDRVYGLQSTKLAKLLCRQLGLSAARAAALDLHRKQGNGDLGVCLERVMLGAGPPAAPAVALQEVDTHLVLLARTCKFSDPKIFDASHSHADATMAMTRLFRRLQPNEAKWMIRLLLKDLSTARIDEMLILCSIHFLLPDILRYQQDFDAALTTCKTFCKGYPSSPDPQSAKLFRKLVAPSMKPQVGVKVSRSEFCKARSIDHCLKMTNKHHYMIERKHDGEYCEIHVDLNWGNDWLKIFSKSSKDSTADRQGIREVIKKSLSIGSPSCKIRSKCILLGEMVVYSDLEQRIMPFHKIRKYVLRSGSSIGTKQDSPVYSHEHLMIVFFDLLLLDDQNMIQEPLEKRKESLRRVCKVKVGRAMVAESRVINFSDENAKQKLMGQLAASVAARHEGLVLKPLGHPYLAPRGPEARHTSTVIKLKKDYINGLGDEADMAVIGASYDAQCATRQGIHNLRFTHFHLGCLVNSSEVRRHNRRAVFRIVGSVSADHCIPAPILRRANALAMVRDRNAGAQSEPSFDVEPSTTTACTLLSEPIIFEVLGSSYEKPSNCDYWMLRHPRVKKLHEDRDWRDCVSFRELQFLAHEAVSAPVASESQENVEWMQKIEQSCRRKIARASAQTTPSTTATRTPASAKKRMLTMTPSPKKRKPTFLLLSPVKRLSQDDSIPETVFTPSPARSAHRNGADSLPTPPVSSAIQPESPQQARRRGEVRLMDDCCSPRKRRRADSSASAILRDIINSPR